MIAVIKYEIFLYYKNILNKIKIIRILIHLRNIP